MEKSMFAGERKFIRGLPYFILMYRDDMLTVPIIQTLLFINEMVGEDEKVEYLFQEIGARGNETPFVVKEEHIDELVVDLYSLIECLEYNAA